MRVMTENLKPCPFCGGEAKLSTYYDFYKVHCNSDDCWAEVSIGDAYNGVGKWYGSVAEAVDAWNTRAERTCHFEERHGDWYCTNCDEMVGTFDPLSELFIDGNAIKEWCYCPNCGAKVVEE